jgi:hypothetical protein
MAPPMFTISTARQKFKLRDIESGNARPASDFKLIGSGQIAEGVTDPLADIRAEQQALADKKLASFGK